MARYEPQEVDVTICVDDTLSKGVESWAWYGLQPINRLTVPNGTVLMTSLQSPEELLKDIHKKDAPYNLALIPAKASFSGLWVYKEDHTEARILGALAKLQPGFLSLDAVCAAIQEAEWGSELKAASARKAHDRLTTRPVKIIEGNSETPFSFRGSHFSVDGAMVEPKPSHRIPIWLGSYGPKALALTGRMADGWNPSYPYAPPAVLGPMRDRVLRAAEAAGRDPSAIECSYNVPVQVRDGVPQQPRMVNGSADEVVDKLAALFRLGMTTLVFWPRGRDEQLERLTNDVLPLLRESVG